MSVFGLEQPNSTVPKIVYSSCTFYLFYTCAYADDSRQRLEKYPEYSTKNVASALLLLLLFSHTNAIEIKHVWNRFAGTEDRIIVDDNNNKSINFYGLKIVDAFVWAALG